MIVCIDFIRISKSVQRAIKTTVFTTKTVVFNFLAQNGVSKNGVGVSSGVSCQNGKNPKRRKSNFFAFLNFLKMM